MNRPTQQALTDLLNRQSDPSISFYLPVEKVGADTRQGAIRLKNMLRATEQALRKRSLKPQQTAHLLQVADALVDDVLFWEHQDRGLALLVAEDAFFRFSLRHPCREAVTIDSQWCLLPLIHDLALDDSFFLLNLSVDDARLYRANPYERTELVLDQPWSLKDELDQSAAKRQLQQHGSGGSAAGTIFHGSGSLSRQERQRTANFFRRLGKAITPFLEEDKPLVVNSVDHLFAAFRAVFKDPRLAQDNVSGSPETLNSQDLLTRAWQIARPLLASSREQALARYRQAAGSGRTIRSIGQVLPVARAGRVETLFVQKDRPVFGDWDPEQGHVLALRSRPDRFGEPDLAGLAARLTLQQGGQVFLLEETDLPDHQGCAAVLRF